MVGCEKGLLCLELWYQFKDDFEGNFVVKLESSVMNDHKKGQDHLCPTSTILQPCVPDREMAHVKVS